jgi:hypothetical protein
MPQLAPARRLKTLRLMGRRVLVFGRIWKISASLVGFEQAIYSVTYGKRDVQFDLELDV